MFRTDLLVAHSLVIEGTMTGFIAKLSMYAGAGAITAGSAGSGGGSAGIIIVIVIILGLVGAGAAYYFLVLGNSKRAEIDNVADDLELDGK